MWIHDMGDVGDNRKGWGGRQAKQTSDIKGTWSIDGSVHIRRTGVLGEGETW